MSSQLERYLREVAVELHELPADEREEQIEEIRVHIEAYMDQHKSAGKSDVEAEQAALAQFGDAAKVGRDIRRARTRKSIRSIAFAALIALALATAVSCLSFRDMVSPATGNKTDLLVSLQVGETLLMGTCVGLILRQFAVKSIVWYYVITLIPGLAVVLLPPLRGVHMSLIGMAANTGVQILVGVVRIGVAFAGAWLGAKMAERLIGKGRPVAVR
jgi:hypothetical protein